MNIKEAVSIVGTLSKPSKMPGYSYGLPAQRCKVGSKLAKVKGSVCSKCYALKGFYTMYKSVRAAQEKRFHSITKKRWVEAMVVLIEARSRKEKFFRWHDSGDLQSVEHLRRICEVARLTPGVRHWLPTREAKILHQFKEEHGAASIPLNLTIRLSATMIEGRAPGSHPWTSTVHSSKYSGWECRAYMNGNKCGSCRACWMRKVKNVSYKVH